MDNSENLTLEAMKYAETLSKTGMSFADETGGQNILIPDAMRLERLSPLEPNLPKSVHQSVNFPDQLSFVNYVNAYKGDRTKIFADLNTFDVTAIFDYHQDNRGGADIAPDYCAHAAIYRPAHSLEWKRWTQAGGATQITQAGLAEFLEENLEDISEPEAAKVLEVVRNLELTRRAEFKSVENAHTGARQLVFKETVQGKGDSNFPIPEYITLGIPVFFGSYAYPVKVYIRFRQQEEKIGFALKIHRAEYVEKAAFQDILHGNDLTKEPEAGSIAQATAVPVYIGSLGR